MRAWWCLLTLPLVACEPPPLVPPTVQIAFPEEPTGEPLEVALVCEPDPEQCGVGVPFTEQLQLTVVVDIDNFELTDPYVDDIEPVEGQGHWHAEIFDLEEPSATRTATIRTEAQPGTVTLTASLRDNLHGPIGIADTLEFRIAEPETPCSQVVVDFCE